ncbi:hypothetical protein BCR42DRAFT_490275 [Absidia repens]|uniref:Histone chaperone RTT106/FACT complex subunit SPT16-like middle domain-containing protein n=1 Tax=Absidia repens TaxID=90262 RepID=A0A1X2IMJ2_9FUNG|nr:hypothetical protein BCR42DRAFT_490275 [Absidia repens]
MILRLDDIDDTQLKKDISLLVDEHESAGPIIQKLIDFYRAKVESSKLDDGGDTKRRKMAQQQHNDDDSDDPLQQCTKIPDLSFQLPARKKYTLVLTKSKLQLMNEKTQTVEHTILANDIVMVTCVPTPEKPPGSFTFALFSQQTSLEPFVFTLADKSSLVIRTTPQDQEEQTLTQPEEKKSALINLLLATYKVITSDQLATPSRQHYVCSGVSPSTGKADTDRTFVKTYLRTKDGVLYFLPQGILFGFKKPTVFVPISLISATVITNVTKHTFDLGLQLKQDHYPLGAGTTSWAPFLQQQQQQQQQDTTSGNGEKDEASATDATILLPFSMIEQTDYAGIERYIQKLGINDQSMTDATKAPEPTKSATKNNQYENETGEDEDEDETMADNTDQRGGGDGDEDDEEDGDVDFVPGENSDDENPLEYDTDASLEDDDDDDEDRGTRSTPGKKRQTAQSDDDEDDEGIDLLDDDDEDE